MTKKFLVLIPILAVALAVMFASPRDSKANSFNPFFGPSTFYDLSDKSPGGHPDTLAQFNVNAPSANFSGLFGRAITFGSSAVTQATAAQIPGTGAYMGQLTSVAQLGLANEGCNSTVPVTFNFIEANVDTTALEIDTVGDGNISTSPDPLLLNGAITSGATSLVYNGANNTDPMGVRVGDNLPVNIIQIDSEEMLITDVNYATRSYVVTRGWEGTTPAAHSSGAHIKRVNIIFPSGPSSNLLANLAQDDGDFDNNGGADVHNDPHGNAPAAGSGVENKDFVNNVADGGDAVPSFIRDSFDPDGNQANGGYVQPTARYWATAFVANSLIVTLQFVIGAPGALTTFPNLQWATSAWGYSSTTFLQDPNAPPSNSAISDFCNFTSNTTIYGWPHDNACTGAVSPPQACTATGAGFTLKLAVDGNCPSTVNTNPNECGMAGQTNGICSVTACPRATNPSTAQLVRYYQYAVSQRDYDADGIENALDVCYNIPNGNNWDPRANNIVSGDDTDGDGLPNECDPAPTTFSNDQDADGWQNRIDNCPNTANSEGVAQGGGTVANTFQFDLDVPLGVNVPDGGPASDSIGPACDIAANSCATDANGNACSVLTPTGANGHYHATAASQTICIGSGGPGEPQGCNNAAGLAGTAGLDDDGDGVNNAQDTCLNGANPPIFFGPPPATAQNPATTLSAPAVAGATTLTVASTAGFINGNPIGIFSPTETLRYITAIGANTITINAGVTAAHAAGANVEMVKFAQSLRDLNNDGFVDISDISLLTGVFGTRGGDPAAAAGYQGRYDTNNDNFVDITDVSALTGMFGKGC